MMRGRAWEVAVVCSGGPRVTPTDRGVDPYGTGGTCPPNIMKGDIHGNVHQYFRSDVV